jgi:hypothetical protein
VFSIGTFAQSSALNVCSFHTCRYFHVIRSFPQNGQTSCHGLLTSRAPRLKRSPNINPSFMHVGVGVVRAGPLTARVARKPRTDLDHFDGQMASSERTMQFLTSALVGSTLVQAIPELIAMSVHLSIHQPRHGNR